MTSRPLLALAATFALAAPASAVIVALDDSAIYTAAPVSDDFGFASVGKVFNSGAGIFGSGVYLGNGWVLGAYHNVANGAGGFVFGSVIFGGIGYTVDAPSAVRLHNPNLSLTDLTVFRLTSNPSVPAVTMSAAAPAIGLGAKMMGNGNDRMISQTQWNVNTAPPTWIWTETGAGGNAAGYKLQPGSQTMRWGNNNIETAPVGLADFGWGTSVAIGTDFGDSSLSAPAGEAQATPGDSGGGVFVKNGADWELAGIMLYTGGYNGQPAATAVYGSETYAANVATYKAEIDAITTVPEPSGVLLTLAGAGFLGARRRRK